jgi:anti-sigma factor ChrR (cupin superfamily)
LKLNADFSRRVAVHSAAMPWTPSPIAGVERRMLDRIGEEVARATTIVRYAPGSHFSPHTHSGGEEFLVLEGVFQDEHGDFPVGTYVRNPPTTRHKPGSEEGCTIFVKLWQFDPADRTQVRINTREATFSAQTDRPGLDVMPLFDDPHENVRLERWPARVQIHIDLPGGGEFLVLAGKFEEGGEEFVAHSWLRLPAGYELQAMGGPNGCTVWVKTGGLRP